MDSCSGLFCKHTIHLASTSSAQPGFTEKNEERHICAFVWVRRFNFSEYDRNTLYDLVQWHTESRVSYRGQGFFFHSITFIWMLVLQHCHSSLDAKHGLFFLSTQFIYDEVWVMTVQAITPVLTQTHLQHSVFMFMKHNVTIAWIIIYLPSPLTSVVAAPFANWIDVVAVLLFISWSMTFWCVRPALQVAGLWPHSSVTSVSWSLAEEIQGKMELGIRIYCKMYWHYNVCCLIQNSQKPKNGLVRMCIVHL